MHPIQIELEAILAERELALDVLGDKTRSEVIVPFCKRYGLEYTSGMGTFFFTLGNVTYNGRDSLPKGRLGKQMGDIFDLLNSEVGWNNCLGFYVGDVSK